jgi:NADH-quinone oxidoreductase subunit L
MLVILAIIPLIVAALVSLAMHKSPKGIRYVALTASIISLAIIILSYYNPVQLQNMNWFALGSFAFTISTSTAPLNMLLLLIVGIMTPLIITYSIGFMGTPSEQSRFYSELCIFAAAMMLFAMSADFLTMFIGWELLGVTSYLLIGFWYKREGAAAAARKAITIILIGDMLMFAAMFIIWGSYNSFSFSVLLQHAGSPSPMVEVALVFIIFAAFTKSAQFPFHEWLPDAMKGPTPVSAFLHSSTMVKAGVFLIAVLLPIFIAYHMLNLLLVFGIITVILAVANALASLDIKRVLAYSTLEDLGLMFIALGSGSLIAAMLLFVAQTFYKALLFMCAGSIIKANDGEEDLKKIRNWSSSLNIFIPTVIAVLSLAGLFPLSGFFGKAAVESASSSLWVYIILVAAAFFSNIYIFRWLFMPLNKKGKESGAGSRHEYRTLPKSMLVPMYIIAILVPFSSFAYIYLPNFLAVNAQIIGVMEIAISIIIVAAGLLISYLIFYKKSRTATSGSVYKILNNNTFLNCSYYSVANLATTISAIVDRFDYALYGIFKSAGHGLLDLGNLLKKMENGSVNAYIAALIIGLILIAIIFIL